MDWIVLGLVCLACAVFAAWWLSPRVAGHSMGSPTKVEDGLAHPVFLFEGDRLISSSSAARPILRALRGQDDWPHLRQWLAKTLADLPESLESLKETGPLFLSSGSDAGSHSALCEWLDGTARVQLIPTGPEGIAAPPQELQNLRAAMNGAPYPVWRLSPEGDVVWANKAYDLLRRKLGLEPRGGGQPLFPEPKQAGPGTAKSRVSIPGPKSDQKLWFDVTVVETDDGTMCYATDVNAIVDAEIAQRNFVQTLAKTFAQLSIGLAIFDRNRQLALFNPALIDLTALQADFLSARPTLFTFFDRLRDRRMMPEPRNYGDWRRQISDLVEAADDGRYQETWTLPSGSVYSISGRPHPDGAVAFLFEDITADVTLTRRFRAELELSQSIIDCLEQAIAVFSADGTLAHSNAAFRALWDCDPDSGFAQMTILDACKIWQRKCAATPFWGDLRDFVAASENREVWTSRVRMTNGTCLNCAVHPVQTGATLVSFGNVGAGMSAKTLAGADVSA